MRAPAALPGQLPLWWDESTLLARLSLHQTEMVSQALEKLGRGQHVEQQNARLTRELAGSLDRLQEVHHRVRNHLQAITGLLSAQEAREESPGARQALRQSITRLTSIAAIHDLLARDPQSGELRLPELADRLSRHLLAQAGAEGRIVVQTRIAPLALGAREATAFVLVLAELLSNAIEHGFPEGRAGGISVELTVASGGVGQDTGGARAVLVVRDTGRGLPEGLVPHLGARASRLHHEEPRQGMGLKLARRLVEGDLRGSMEARNEGGACIRMTFPVGVCGRLVPGVSSRAGPRPE